MASERCMPWVPAQVPSPYMSIHQHKVKITDFNEAFPPTLGLFVYQQFPSEEDRTVITPISQIEEKTHQRA